MNLNQFSGTATQTATQFVIAQEKIGLLLGTGGKTFKRIGSLFKVHIHLTSGHHQSGEWVSIYGKEEDRGKAKEYIMSMCNPMVEEQIQYTADLHEHLVGKGGKTHRYLESNSSAVITFSTSCTAPNEHTAHVRGSRESVEGACALIKGIISKTTKRRQKETQPPSGITTSTTTTLNYGGTSSLTSSNPPPPPQTAAGGPGIMTSPLKPEELDKELLQALKAANKLAQWDHLKTQSEDAKKSYLVQLRKNAAATTAASNSTEQNTPNGMQRNSGSEGGNKGCSPSRAELLSYAKKLNMEEEGIKVLKQSGTGTNKNVFLANLIQSRNLETKKPEAFHSLPQGAYRPNEFRSYPNCISEYRDKAESLVSQTMPHGLVARSIGPFPGPTAAHTDTLLDPHHPHHHAAAAAAVQQQLPSFHQDLPDHFSSAPAQFSSRRPHGYEPGSALTFEQILAQRKLHQHHQESGGGPPDESQSELLLKLLLEKKMEEQSEKVQDLLFQHQRQQQQQYAAAQQFKRTEELLSLYKRSAGPLLNQAQNPGGAAGLGLNLSGISGMASYPGLNTANLAAAASIPRSTPLHQSGLASSLSAGNLASSLLGSNMAGNLPGPGSLCGGGPNGMPTMNGFGGLAGSTSGAAGGLPSSAVPVTSAGAASGGPISPATNGNYDMFGPIGARGGGASTGPPQRGGPDNLNLDFLDSDSVDIQELLAHLNI